MLVPGVGPAKLESLIAQGINTLDDLAASSVVLNGPQQRMMKAVADADVVVVNPTHYAVALQYRPPEQASPKVLAKGRNHVALKIRRRAESLGIPIVENPPVARLLYRTAKVDREIPEKLYQVVAEVLAYVYKLDPSRRNRWRAA